MTLRIPVSTFFIFLALALTIQSCAFAVQAKNGFDLSEASIPSNQIFRGGPPKDGIPAIDKPRYVSADEAHSLKEDDRVLGLVIGDDARAYPIRILNWHEIVNDRIQDNAVVISFCPLCGTGMAFKASAGGTELSFGVSGLLYQSDVLMYDRQTNSLWSQILNAAVSGPLKGQTLEQLPLQHTSWKHWRQQHPNTQVLSEKTGSNRDYERDPYQGYESSSTIYFDTQHSPPKAYHPKELVLGIQIGDTSKAYPFSELSAKGISTIQDTVEGQTLRIHWDEDSGSAYATLEAGKLLATTTAYWFAWYTFHPDTLIFKAD